MLSQCLLSAVDRDALSGWGAVVHIMYVHAHAHVNVHVYVQIVMDSITVDCYDGVE